MINISSYNDHSRRYEGEGRSLGATLLMADLISGVICGDRGHF